MNMSPSQSIDLFQYFVSRLSCSKVSASGVSAIPVLGETAPSSGGIPGLDLIDSSGAKPSPYIVPTSISVSVGSMNKPIETPTDSEPFNFPQPKNAGWPQMPPMSGPPPGMGGPPMGMPPMSGPPPGFMGMFCQNVLSEPKFHDF